jgi:hypothetical protein
MACLHTHVDKKIGRATSSFFLPMHLKMYRPCRLLLFVAFVVAAVAQACPTTEELCVLTGGVMDGDTCKCSQDKIASSIGWCYPDCKDEGGSGAAKADGTCRCEEPLGLDGNGYCKCPSTQFTDFSEVGSVKCIECESNEFFNQRTLACEACPYWQEPTEGLTGCTDTCPVPSLALYDAPTGGVKCIDSCIEHFQARATYNSETHTCECAYLGYNSDCSCDVASGFTPNGVVCECQSGFVRDGICIKKEARCPDDELSVVVRGNTFGDWFLHCVTCPEGSVRVDDHTCKCEESATTPIFQTTTESYDFYTWSHGCPQTPTPVFDFETRSTETGFTVIDRIREVAEATEACDGIVFIPDTYDYGLDFLHDVIAKELIIHPADLLPFNASTLKRLLPSHVGTLCITALVHALDTQQLAFHDQFYARFSFSADVYGYGSIYSTRSTKWGMAPTLITESCTDLSIFETGIAFTSDFPSDPTVNYPFAGSDYFPDYLSGQFDMSPSCAALRNRLRGNSTLWRVEGWDSVSPFPPPIVTLDGKLRCPDNSNEVDGGWCECPPGFVYVYDSGQRDLDKLTTWDVEGHHSYNPICHDPCPHETEVWVDGACCAGSTRDGVPYCCPEGMKFDLFTGSCACDSGAEDFNVDTMTCECQETNKDVNGDCCFTAKMADGVCCDGDSFAVSGKAGWECCPSLYPYSSGGNCFACPEDTPHFILESKTCENCADNGQMYSENHFACF